VKEKRSPAATRPVPPSVSLKNPKKPPRVWGHYKKRRPDTRRNDLRHYQTKRLRAKTEREGYVRNRGERLKMRDAG